MLLFLQSVSCFYLFHNRTQRFIGEVTANESKVKFTSYNHPEPVGEIEKATDFRMGHTNDPRGITATIEHPTSGKTLDVESGGNRTDLPLIFFGTHRGGAQQFQLLLLADNSFVLGYRDKCIRYDEAKNGFFSHRCEDLKDSTFDIYYEVPPTPEYFKEQVFNLNDRESNASGRDYEFIKSTNPLINGSNNNMVTEITFENGKAIAKTPINKDITDMKFEHVPVRIHKEKRSLRHISRRNGHREHKRGDSSDASNVKSSKRKGCRIADLALEACTDSSSSDNYSYSSDSDIRETHRRVRKERLLHGEPTKSHGMAKVARDGIYV